MLQIRNVTITHKKDNRVILNDLSLALNAGDKAVIIGEEGNGKSTLLKWIYDPALVESYADVSGERVLSRERVAYLPQELPAEDREISVYEFFCREEIFAEGDYEAISDAARRAGMNADDMYLDRPMRTLSGGERVRAQLARLMLRQPTVLLLDEPSNDLDIASLERLERLLREWDGIALFISHDETLITRTANMVVHIEQLRRKTVSRATVMHLGYEEYIERRTAGIERQAQQAVNDARAKRERDERFRRIHDAVEHAQGAVSRQDPHAAKMLKRKMGAVVSMGKRFEREDENMTEAPEFEEAIAFTIGTGRAFPAGKTVTEYTLDTLTAPNGTVLARNIALTVRGAEKLCIIGDNGAGKTTLFRRIADELRARKDIRVEYMPQNYEELLNMDVTPVDFLNEKGDKETRTRLRTTLGSLKFTADEMEHPIRELSGGQKAKVFLLKMSLNDPDVLLLDEPTRNFSPLSGPVIRKMLADFPGAILSISHDRKYIREVCGRVLRLTKDGLTETEIE